MTKSELNALPYQEYLESEHWMAVRQMMLGMYPHCALCHSDNRLNVHHNNYKNRGAETHLDLIVLCYSCHGKFHGKNNDPVEKIPTNVISIVTKKPEPRKNRMDKFLSFWAFTVPLNDERYRTKKLESPIEVNLIYLTCCNLDKFSPMIIGKKPIKTLIHELIKNSHTHKKTFRIPLDERIYFKAKRSETSLKAIEEDFRTILNSKHSCFRIDKSNKEMIIEINDIDISDKSYYKFFFEVLHVFYPYRLTRLKFQAFINNSEKERKKLYGAYMLDYIQSEKDMLDKINILRPKNEQLYKMPKPKLPLNYIE